MKKSRRAPLKIQGKKTQTNFSNSEATFRVFFTLGLLRMTSNVLRNSCNISPHQVFIINVKFEWL